MAERTEEKWYDAADLTELHDDLRANFNRTVMTLSKRPVLITHFDKCPICQEIREQHHANLPTQMAVESHKRELIRLDNARLRFVLGLPADVEIVAAQVNMDPLYIDFLITGPNLPDVPLFAPAARSTMTH